MLTSPTTQLIQWQDLKVRSELDIVLEIANQKGWNDCEVFGSGIMITQPQESIGWKLIPADLYEYSIPAEGVNRVLQVINAGVRIQGVIIADDERRPAAPPKPARPKITLPSVKAVVSFACKALLLLIMVVGIIAISPFLLLTLPLVGVGSTDADYDPKLIILVDDGNGNTMWISLLTWYE